MSVSLPDQLKQILDVVGISLSNVHTYDEKEVEYETKRQESARQQREKLRRIQRGEWHDGRLDCVAGNGIMSELGIGDERFCSDDADVVAKEADSLESEVDEESKSSGHLGTARGLPVVVIRGFEDKVGGRSELLDVVARWATSLADNQVCGLQASPFCGSIVMPPRLDRTCHRVERQPGKRQTTCERYGGCCGGSSQAIHTPLQSIPRGLSTRSRSLMPMQRPLLPSCRRNSRRRNWTSNLHLRQPPLSNVWADEQVILTTYVPSTFKRLLTA